MEKRKIWRIKGEMILLSNESSIEGYYEDVLYSILNAKEDGLTLVWNKQNEIILCTNTVETYFNRTLDEVINHSWHFIFPEHIVQQIIDHFHHSTAPFVLTRLTIQTDTTKKVHFTVKIENIKEILYVCSLQDITKTYELESSLNRVEKSFLTAQISAHIVHEIRNPLTSIKGFLQLIESGIEHRDEYFSVLINEIEKIEGLTYELLQLANPNKDKKKVVAVQQLLNDVMLLMKSQAAMKQIDFDIFGDLDATVYCNANEIKQVLINLILNATDAMEGEGTITIDVVKEEQSVKIKVIDSGHGMSDELKQQITKPFFTTKKDGTGLGLVVTNHILEKHHGKLSIISFENDGSTFEVQLPLLLTN